MPWSVERFMQSTGRQKTTLAIYRALMKAPEQAFKDFVSLLPTSRESMTASDVLMACG